MKLEYQVCSIELSKKLKELGIKQKSIFIWECFNETAYSVKFFPFSMVSIDEKIQVKEYELYSAFTASELLSFIPMMVDTRKDEPFNNFRFNMQLNLIVNQESYTAAQVNSINYNCDTIQLESGSPFFSYTLFNHNIYDENLANAFAKVLIKLIEDGYLKI